MAVTLQELVVKIQGDVADLKSAMSESQALVKSGTDGMKAAVHSFSQQAHEDMGFFKHAAETALGVFEGEAIEHALEHIGEAIKEHLIEMIKEDIKAASENEDALTRMNVALAGAGHYSEESSKELQEFAEHMMKTTGTTVAATEAASGYLEMLTKLDAEGVQKATHASIELAAVLGVDVTSASHMVARAIEGHVTALQRSGIEMEVGANAAENLTNLITALGSNMNVAEKMTGTYSGALRVNAAQHEELSAAIGEVFTQNQSVINIINEATKIYGESTNSVKSNQQAYRELVSEGIDIVITALTALLVTVDYVERAFEVAFEMMVAPVKWVIAAIVGLQQAMSGDMKGALDALNKNFEASFSDIGNAITGKSKLDDLANMLARVKVASDAGFGAASAGAKNLQNSANGAADAVHKLTDEEQKLYDEGEKDYNAELKKDPKEKYTKELKALEFYHSQAKGLDNNYEMTKVQLMDDLHAKQTEEHDKELKDLQAQNDLLRKIDQDKYAGEIADNQAKIDKMLADDDVSRKAQLENEYKVSEAKRHMREQDLKSASDIMGNLVTVGKAMGKEGFEFAKQASAAQAIINTFEAATKALTAGPILGPNLMGTTIAAGMAQVYTIESTHLATGLDTVPGIGFGDSFPAMLTPGEGVVDAGTNKDMKAFFGGGGKNAMLDALGAIADKVDQLSKAVMQTPTTVIVGGKTISDTLRQEIRQGRKVFA